MASPFPLAAAIAVPIVFLIPTGILLYILAYRLRHDDTTPVPAHQTGGGDLRARNQNAASSKTSLASLDVRPFLDTLYARTGEYNVSAVAKQNPAVESETLTSVRPALFSYALGILLSLLCGLVYLSCATSSGPSSAVNFPLGISVTVIPFLVLPYSIEDFQRRIEKPLVAGSGGRWRVCWRFGLPIGASIVIASLGAWVSGYIVVAILAVTLVSISVLALDNARWPLAMVSSRSQNTDASNRKTKSWFSGNGLSEADAEALARQGNVPRAGESEDAFLERMQREGNSWITETGKLERSLTSPT